MIVKKYQDGFTLVELLIATAVFSVVLLLCTTGLIKISRSYTKGVIATRTQEAARKAIDSISQTLQLTPGNFSGLKGPVGDTSAYCIGNQQFSFILNEKIVSSSPGAGETHHALLAHPIISSGCTINSIDSPTAAGQELLAPQMQLANLDIQSLPDGRFRITVRVIYGDDDLFLNPNTPSASCKPSAGSEFCAVSELSTIVQRRVQ